MKFKTLVLLTILVLALSACSSSVPSSPAPSEVPTTQPTEVPPTPVPDTPAPPKIDAPLVEAPSLVSIHFINELDGWGVTETQIVRTNDGGITWYNVTPSAITNAGYNVQLSFLDNNNVWINVPDVSNYPNGGTMYRTSDGGLTWSSSASPFSKADIQFLDTNNGWALADLGVGAGSNAVAVYQTTDGGSTWNLKFIDDPNQANAGDSLPLSGLKYGITPINMQTAWVYGTIYSSGSVYVFRTDDGGANWTPISLPLPQGVENAQLSFEKVQFVTANDAFMTMRIALDESKMAVYVSNDAGTTWTLTTTPIPVGGSADFLSANEAVIYNGQQFYVTRDAANTWNTISPDVVFGDTFAMMDFVNINTGWVITLDSANHRSLYRTTDGGSTWSPVIP